MKNVQVENFIKREKKELLVSAKEEIRKGVLGINIRLKAQFVDLPSHISLEKQQELIKISEENRKEFPQEFLNQELEGREITSLLSRVCKSKYKRPHDLFYGFSD